MRTGSSLALALLMVLAPSAGGQQTDTTAAPDYGTPDEVLPDTAPWLDMPGFPGVQVKRLVGSTTASGPYLVRVKLAAGTRLPPHSHPDARLTFVLSGTLWVGFGEGPAAGDAVPVHAGSLYVAPAGVPHYVWAEDAEVTYQESGIGPSATILLSPPPGGG